MSVLRLPSVMLSVSPLAMPPRAFESLLVLLTSVLRLSGWQIGLVQPTIMRSLAAVFAAVRLAPAFLPAPGHPHWSASAGPPPPRFWSSTTLPEVC